MGSFVGSFVGPLPWVGGAGGLDATWAGRMWVVSSQFGWFGGLGLGWKQTEVGGGLLGRGVPGKFRFNETIFECICMLGR